MEIYIERAKRQEKLVVWTWELEPFHRALKEVALQYLNADEFYTKK